MERETMFEPVFARQQDIRGGRSVKPIDMCQAIASSINRNNVDGAQLIHGIWRLYLKSAEARVDLMTKGLFLNGIQVPLFDKNPRSTNNDDPNTRVEKIVIHDLPLSVDNDTILNYLKDQPQVTLTSEIRYSRERTQEGKLTTYRNGDRFVYAIHPINPPLPETEIIGPHRVRLYHQSQKDVCKVCGKVGHKINTPVCPAYDPSLKVEAFQSHYHIMSNMYPCDINAEGYTFKSAEHYYQWSKAVEYGRDDVAEKILFARHAGIAKGIASKELPHTEEWKEKKLDVMRKVIQAKMTSHPAFWTALIESKSLHLVEATRDQYWGCGFTPEIARHTKPEYYTGSNMLGILLMDARDQELVRGMEDVFEYDDFDFEDIAQEADGLTTPPWLRKHSVVTTSSATSRCTEQINTRLQQIAMEGECQQKQESDIQEQNHPTEHENTNKLLKSPSDHSSEGEKEKPLEKEDEQKITSTEDEPTPSQDISKTQGAVRRRMRQKFIGRHVRSSSLSNLSKDTVPLKDFLSKKRPANSPPQDDINRQRRGPSREEEQNSENQQDRDSGKTT